MGGYYGHEENPQEAILAGRVFWRKISRIWAHSRSLLYDCDHFSPFSVFQKNNVLHPKACTPTSWPYMKQIFFTLHPPKKGLQNQIRLTLLGVFGRSLSPVNCYHGPIPAAWDVSPHRSVNNSPCVAIKPCTLAMAFGHAACCGRTRSIAIREFLGEFLENICCTAVFGIIKTLHGMFAISMHA